MNLPFALNNSHVASLTSPVLKVIDYVFSEKIDALKIKLKDKTKTIFLSMEDLIKFYLSEID